MGECLLAVPGMGARAQRTRVKQALGIWADCLVMAWTDELSAGALFRAGATQAGPLERDRAGDRALGAKLADVHTRMVKWIVDTPPEEVAAAHPDNRLIAWDDIAAVTLEWRRFPQATRLTLRLRDGEELELVTKVRAQQRFAALERALGKSAAAGRVEVTRRP